MATEAKGTAMSQGNLSSQNPTGRFSFPRSLVRNAPAAPPPANDDIKVLRVEGLHLHVAAKRVPDLDALLRRLGNPGRYQFLAFILLSLTSLVVAPSNLAVVFWGEEPGEYLCNDRTPSLETLVTFNNSTAPYTFDQYQSWVLVDGRHNSSDRRQCTVSMTIQSPEIDYEGQYFCRNWSFPDRENGPEASTIVTNFQLVCGERWRVSLSTTIYFLGLMIGSLIFGFLGDYYGRRVMVLMSGSAAVIVGVGTSFARTYAIFVVLRFVFGILLQGLQIAFILIVEWLPVGKRSCFGALAQLMWSLGIMFLAFLGYLFPTWNDLQLAISLVGLLLVMTYFFLVEESVRWLLVKGRVEEASDSVVKVLRFNRIATDMTWEMEHEVLSLGTFLREQEDKKGCYTFIDCFRTPRLRKMSLCMMYIWFACSIGYYGLFLSIDRIVDDLAINIFINGVLELIPCLISVIVVPRYGRKQPMIIFNFLGGFACILSCLVRGSGQSSQMGRTALTLIGRTALTGSFCSFFIWTAELYPTIIRGNGIGVCMFALRLGGVLAPQLLALGDHTFREFPVTAIGIIALGGVVAAYPLPETLNISLADTISEAENFGCKQAELTKSRNGLSVSSLTSVRMSHISQ